MVVAEELDADWSRVTHRPGPRRHQVRLAEHRRLLLDQGLLRAMRVAGATARTMLEQAAAAEWKVPCRRGGGAEPRRRPHAERADARLRRLVAAAATLPVPDAEGAAASRQRPTTAYVGKTVRITDLDDIVTRQGHLRHRRAHAGDGLCGDRAAAGPREQLTRVDDAAASARSPASRRCRPARRKPRRPMPSRRWAASR